MRNLEGERKEKSEKALTHPLPIVSSSLREYVKGEEGRGGKGDSYFFYNLPVRWREGGKKKGSSARHRLSLTWVLPSVAAQSSKREKRGYRKMPTEFLFLLCRGSAGRIKKGRTDGIRIYLLSKGDARSGPDRRKIKKNEAVSGCCLSVSLLHSLLEKLGYNTDSGGMEHGREKKGKKKSLLYRLIGARKWR